MKNWIQFFFTPYQRRNPNPVTKSFIVNVQKQPPGCSMKRAVLKNFAICIGKHLCWNFFLIKFIKRRLQQSCFPVNIGKYL